ncbi:FtsX-like permease family protein [Dactylosporangium sp. NPDC051541]|uniref:FtsX-like permease family protein n=1 Tax=Dactylosporangium sp. NPDC051541 TaxID=3363977 RepID=UPI0037A33C0C
MSRVYVAALGPGAPVPPGLDRLPGPGELAASPALQRLLRDTPDDELDDRFPGRVALTIRPEGLGHDNELVGIIGRTPEQLIGVRSVGTVHGFTGVRPTAWAITRALTGFTLMCALLVLVPVVLLITAVSRVTGRRRERRAAALRLAGATRAQTALVAAAEAGLAAVAGTGLGWLLYEAGRRIVARTVVFQRGHFWLADLAVPGPWLAAILLGTPLFVMLICVVSLQRVQRHPRPQSANAVLLLMLGLGLAFTHPAWGLVALLGFVFAGPWLVAGAGRALAWRPRGVATLLAARRIAHDPRAAFWSVATVGAAAAALAYLGSTATVAPSGAPAPPPGIMLINTGHAVLEVPFDGSLAAENRIRTRAANETPNAIINSSRDPIDRNLETFLLDLGRLAAIGAGFALVTGAFGLAAGVAASALERRRPVRLLRIAGVRRGELRRAALLETATAMTVISVAGFAVGLLLGLAGAHQGQVAWHWPAPGLYAVLGGGVGAAVLFTVLALPLHHEGTMLPRSSTTLSCQ